MKAPPNATVGSFALAVWIFWGFGYETVWKRFITEANGVVTSSHDVPSTGAPRYSTEYVIRDENGRDHDYIARATDASLARSLPVGTDIRKEWGRLDYAVNGKTVRFPAYFYSAILGVAVFCLLWGGVRWLSSRDNKGRVLS